MMILDCTMMMLMMPMLQLMVFVCAYYTKRATVLSPLKRMMMQSFGNMMTMIVLVMIWQHPHSCIWGKNSF